MEFTALNIHPKVLKAIEEEQYHKPTPIQEKAIPSLLKGRDLLGRADTGTGKTAAFAIPILSRLAEDEYEESDSHPVKALILAPTRELAIQIEERFSTYGKYLDHSCGVVYGGVTPKRHIKVLKRQPSVLVATPGRLLDLVDRGAADLSHVEVLVLDEADRMLDLGMSKDVQKILAMLPRKRQNMLFSATMPSSVKKLVNGILKNPIRVEIAPSPKDKPLVEQKVYLVEAPDKTQLLIDILKKDSFDSVLVFVRTKKKADKVSKAINISNIQGVLSKSIHGDKHQADREKVMGLFREQKIKVLVATDVAARGIDVNDLSLVINLDIPKVPETYTHRIGRTGRAGKSGQVISFCSQDELDDLKEIEKYQKYKIEVVSIQS